MTVPVIHSARYHIDIGPHVFPTDKYQLIVDRLIESRLVAASDVTEPEPATWSELELVHTSEYLGRMRDGSLTGGELAQLQLPWSPELVEAFRSMTGGTVLAARMVCGLSGSARHPAACHIGGGLHHAFPNHGEGFCPFNDVAVAVRVLQRHGAERHAVIDLDVHHGNGTAFIFERDPRVYTLSLHQQHNYPMWKPRGSCDVGLADGVHDATYIRELERVLPDVIAHRPDCVFYLAGADPFEDDQLGGLRLSREGLRRRDRLVIEAVAVAQRPLVVVLAGGYARNVEDTVAIHCATVEEVLKKFF